MEKPHIFHNNCDINYEILRILNQRQQGLFKKFNYVAIIPCWKLIGRKGGTCIIVAQPSELKTAEVKIISCPLAMKKNTLTQDIQGVPKKRTFGIIQAHKHGLQAPSSLVSAESAFFLDTLYIVGLQQ